jgi:hypothetical protein
MPQIGERRSGATETVEWDGQRWQPVQHTASNGSDSDFMALLSRADALSSGGGGPQGQRYERATPAQPSAEDMAAYTQERPSTVKPVKPNLGNPVHTPGWTDWIPGFNDVVNLAPNLIEGAKALPGAMHNLFLEPDKTGIPNQTIRGGVQGASEAATPGRTGLLALLTGGATLPATLGAAGAQAAVEGARYLSGAENAPTSPMDAITDIGEAALVPGAPAAIGKYAPKVAAMLPTNLRPGNRTKGAVLGGLVGYRHGGLVTGPGMLGGIEGALEGGLIGNRLTKSNVLGGLAEAAGLGAEKEEGAAAAKATRSSTDWSKDASARPTWDPAGPSKRAASEAAQQAARTRASNVKLGDIGNVPYRTPEPTFTGNDIANATDTYDRAVPGEFANRSSSLGQSTLKTMRDAGYEVPEGGFQSSRDIDNIANGPNPDALAAQAAIRKPPSNPPFLKFAAEPDFVDNLPDVPDFSYEPGYSDIPGSTVGETGSNPLSSRQTARPVDTRGAASALQELLNTPSFRRLRRQ